MGAYSNSVKQLITLDTALEQDNIAPDELHLGSDLGGQMSIDLSSSGINLDKIGLIIKLIASAVEKGIQILDSAGSELFSVLPNGNIRINDSELTATVAELNVLDGIPAGLTAIELGYSDGVTSGIQAQLDAKQAIVSGVSDTEIGYLDGVTSAIQTQLDANKLYTRQVIPIQFFINKTGNTFNWALVSDDLYIECTHSGSTGSADVYFYPHLDGRKLDGATFTFTAEHQHSTTGGTSSLSILPQFLAKDGSWTDLTKISGDNAGIRTTSGTDDLTLSATYSNSFTAGRQYRIKARLSVITAGAVTFSARIYNMQVTYG